MRTLFVMLVFSLAAVAGDLPKKPANATQNEIWEASISLPFSAINASDGIDELEANFLAYWYFLKYGGMCGCAEPVRHNDPVWWTSGTVIGPRGDVVGTIKIHRKLGIITWDTGRPWMAPPWKELGDYITQYQKMEALERAAAKPASP